MAYRATEHTESKKAATRARLLHEARQIVSSQGFRALSISAAASQTGIATGTVYRYYPSKSDLCVAIFEQATQHEIDAVIDASATGQNATERVQSALYSFCQRAQQNPTLAYALIAEPVDPDLEQVRLQYRGIWADAFAQLLKPGIDSGEFYPQHPKISASAIVGAMAESIIISLRSQREQKSTKHSKQNITDSIVAFCMRAVLKNEEA